MLGSSMTVLPGSPVDFGKIIAEEERPLPATLRRNRRPHPATASVESCRRCGHGLVSLTDPNRPSSSINQP
jgi:hypothetical protein